MVINQILPTEGFIPSGDQRLIPWTPPSPCSVHNPVTPPSRSRPHQDQTKRYGHVFTRLDCERLANLLEDTHNPTENFRGGVAQPVPTSSPPIHPVPPTTPILDKKSAESSPLSIHSEPIPATSYSPNLGPAPQLCPVPIDPLTHDTPTSRDRETTKTISTHDLWAKPYLAHISCRHKDICLTPESTPPPTRPSTPTGGAAPAAASAASASRSGGGQIQRRSRVVRRPVLQYSVGAQMPPPQNARPVVQGGWTDKWEGELMVGDVGELDMRKNSSLPSLE